MFSLYKRGRVWWAYIDGERKSTRQTDKAAADAVCREWERRAADPTYAAACETVLADAIPVMIGELRRRGRAGPTLGIHREKGGHLVRLLPPTLADVDAKAVDAYLTQRETEGASTVTLAKELSTLRQTLKSAARRGEYHRPLEQVMPVGFSPRYVPRVRWLPREEVEELLRTVDARRAAHIAFIVATSASLGESVTARREDVDRNTWTVLLRGTKRPSRWRRVPIAPIFRDLLLRALHTAPGGEVLFAPWGRLHRDLKAACARVGIAPCSPNDLRRTHAMWLRNAGVEPALIYPVLGHTTSKMVETVYGRIDHAALGALLEERVRGLYTNDQNNAPNGHGRDTQVTDITAPPGRFERPANGLGKRRRAARFPEQTAPFAPILLRTVRPLYTPAVGLAALLATDPDAYALALEAAP